MSFKNYSWSPWLRSTQAIDDGTVIFYKPEDRAPRHRHLTARPAEAPGLNPDIRDDLCFICRWMLNNLRLMVHRMMGDVIIAHGRPKTYELRIKHWATTLLLVKAASEGCRLCNMLWMSRRVPEQTTGTDEWPIETFLLSSPRMDQIGLGASWGISQDVPTTVLAMSLVNVDGM